MGRTPPDAFGMHTSIDNLRSPGTINKSLIQVRMPMKACIPGSGSMARWREWAQSPPSPVLRGKNEHTWASAWGDGSGSNGVASASRSGWPWSAPSCYT